MSDLDRTIEVVIDARKAERGADKVEDALDDITKATKQTSDKSGKSLDKMDKKFTRVGSSAEASKKGIDILKGALVFTAAVATVGLLANALVNVASEIDDIAAAAGKANVSTEFFQTLEFAASQSGVELTTVNGLLKDLTIRSGQAAQGNKPVLESFNKIGISIRDASGNMKGMEQLLPEVITGLQGLSSDAERAAIGMELMGENAVEATNLLKPGAKSLEDFNKQAQGLGLILSKDVFDNAARVNSQFDIMNRVIQGELAVAMSDLTPLLVAGANALIIMAKWAADLTLRFGRFIGIIDKVNVMEKLNADSKTLQSSLPSLINQLEKARKVLTTFSLTEEQRNAQLEIIQSLKQEVALVEERNKAANPDQTALNTSLDVFENEAALDEKALSDSVTRLANSLKTEELLRLEAADKESQIILEALNKQLISREDASDLIVALGQRESDRLQTILDEEEAIRADAFKKEIDRQVQLALVRLENADAGLNAVRQSLLTQEELLIQSLEKQQASVQEAFLVGLISKQENDDLQFEITRRTQERITAIRKIETDRQLANDQAAADKRIALENTVTSALLASATAVSRVFADTSNTAFQVAKGFAIAQATINAFQSITKTLADGGAFAIPAAIATGAMAFAQVAAILRTQPGQSSTTTGVTGGVGIGNAQRTPDIVPTENRDNTSAQVINNTFIIQGVAPEEYVESTLVPIMSKVIDNTDAILFSNESRQAQELQLGGAT